MPRFPKRIQGCSPVLLFDQHAICVVCRNRKNWHSFTSQRINERGQYSHLGKRKWAFQLQTDPASLACLLRRHTFLRAHNREFLVSPSDREQRTNLAPCRNCRIGRQTAHPKFSGEASEFQLHDLLAQFSMQKGCRTQTIA